MAEIQVVPPDPTGVHELIAREARGARWGVLWLWLTLAALLVAGFAVAELWPPRTLPEPSSSSMQAQ